MSQTEKTKLIENEVIFRRLNDAMRTRVDAMFQGEARHVPLQLYCECSNEDCRRHVMVDPAEYEAAHSDPRRFIALPGHEVDEVEEVVERHDAYNVVRKYDLPPDSTDMRLNETDL